jgi:5-methylcytosine-specific restriction protein A
MPDAPMGYCPCSPSCPVRVKRGQRCQRGAQQRERYKGTRHERGYDNAWVKLRARFLSISAHQFCCVCERKGHLVPTDEVDHIIPFNGKDDPLRLEWTNLQGLCSRCHDDKHRAQRARR